MLLRDILAMLLLGGSGSIQFRHTTRFQIYWSPSNHPVLFGPGAANILGSQIDWFTFFLVRSNLLSGILFIGIVSAVGSRLPMRWTNAGVCRSLFISSMRRMCPRKGRRICLLMPCAPSCYRLAIHVILSRYLVSCRCMKG